MAGDRIIHKNSFIDDSSSVGGCIGSFLVISFTIFLIGYLPSAHLKGEKRGNGPVLEYSTNSLGVLVKVPKSNSGKSVGITLNGREVPIAEILSFSGFRGSTYYLYQIQYPEKVHLKSTYNYSFSVSEAEEYHGYIGSSPTPNGRVEYYRSKTPSGYAKHTYEFNFLPKEEYYSNENVLSHFVKLEKRIINKTLPDKITNRFRKKNSPKKLHKSLESIIQLAILRRSPDDLQRLSSICSDPWLYNIHGEDLFADEIIVAGEVLSVLVK